MTAPRFDPDDIMRAVRAAAKPSSPATTATLLQNEPNRSNVAIVAGSPVPASFFDPRCSVCGQPARFGYGVGLLHGEEGRWFCAAHRPETGRA
jgi:hypothetical protein